MTRHEGSFTGVVTLLTAFVILLLGCFSMLMLVSANSDRELAAQSARAVEEYYAADTLAEEWLGELCGLVGTGDWVSRAQDAGFTVKEDGTGYRVEYAVAVNDIKALHVILTLTPEPGGNGYRVERGEWRTAVTKR